VKEILELEDSSILAGGTPLAGLKAELVAGIAKVRESLVIILQGERLLEAESYPRPPSEREPPAGGAVETGGAGETGEAEEAEEVEAG